MVFVMSVPMVTFTTEQPMSLEIASRVHLDGRLQPKLLAKNVLRTSLVNKEPIATRVPLDFRHAALVRANVPNASTVIVTVSVPRASTYQRTVVNTVHRDMSLWEVTKTNVSNAQKEHTNTNQARAVVFCAKQVDFQQLVLTPIVTCAPKDNINRKRARATASVVCMENTPN